jgi:hypothetical protein
VLLTTVGLSISGSDLNSNSLQVRIVPTQGFVEDNLASGGHGPRVSDEPFYAQAEGFFTTNTRATATNTRDTATWTAKQAQERLPPRTSVFVGNLPRRCSDEYLEARLLDLFCVYGQCWIIIRRQVNNFNPYAFVQFLVSYFLAIRESF